jgi:hypothetical protein
MSKQFTVRGESVADKGCPAIHTHGLYRCSLGGKAKRG